MRKTSLAVAAALATLASLVVIAPASQAASQAATQAAGPVRVVRWVDGDTVETNRGTVRLIGVDTPESGKCGYLSATQLANRIAPAGSVVRLGNPKSVQNADRYGRLLRYVNSSKWDVSGAQITHGAWARYDSRDGYQHHPRQAKYRRLDNRSRNYCGNTSPGQPSKPSQPSKPGSGGTVSAPVGPLGHNCPSYAPIKGNAGSMIYHRPGQQYYAATTPEDCFRNAASAERAGYRAAKI